MNNCNCNDTECKCDNNIQIWLEQKLNYCNYNLDNFMINSNLNYCDWHEIAEIMFIVHNTEPDILDKVDQHLLDDFNRLCESAHFKYIQYLKIKDVINTFESNKEKELLIRGGDTNEVQFFNN